MNHRQLVRRAIDHQHSPVPPRGEICIGPGFIEKLLGRPYRGLADRQETIAALGLDLVVVSTDLALPAGLQPESAIREIEWWRQRTDLYILVLVTGPFRGGLDHIPFEQYCRLTLKAPQEILELSSRAARDLVRLAKSCVRAGADGVIIGDDLACNRHTLLSPPVLRKMIFPFLQQSLESIRRTGAPVFFHSDGNINPVLADLAAMGFAGIHSLQPSAGMRIAEIKKRYGRELTLWGNIEFTAYPRKTAQELRARAVKIVAAAAAGGGFIFGSSTGLADDTPVDAVVGVYQRLREYSA
ncbi:MAG: hypothetical protein GXP57_09800 [Deltaproteobacteria bacterium]|nr:hypothetical protein [Deltaproteobacteria bacterium]